MLYTSLYIVINTRLFRSYSTFYRSSFIIFFFLFRCRNKTKQKGESCLQNGYYLGLNRILPIHGKAAPLINWPASAPSLSFPVRLRSTSSVRRLDRSKAPKLTATFVNWNAFDQSTSTKEVGNTSVLTNGDQILRIFCAESTRFDGNEPRAVIARLSSD